MHAHIHLIPRRARDPEEPTGGVRAAEAPTTRLLMKRKVGEPQLKAT
jgi:diadenosine tetraphosphate (Ap4A) HIT family hydrolase